MQMCILDGNAYDAKCMDGCPDRGRDLASCSLLLNNKQTPLLASGAPGVHTQEHRVVVQLLVGHAHICPRSHSFVNCGMRICSCHYLLLGESSRCDKHRQEYAALLVQARVRERTGR
jgi:hypothetical protein